MKNRLFVIIALMLAIGTASPTALADSIDEYCVGNKNMVVYDPVSYLITPEDYIKKLNDSIAALYSEIREKEAQVASDQANRQIRKLELQELKQSLEKRLAPLKESKSAYEAMMVRAATAKAFLKTIPRSLPLTYRDAKGTRIMELHSNGKVKFKDLSPDGSIKVKEGKDLDFCVSTKNNDIKISGVYPTGIISIEQLNLTLKGNTIEMNVRNGNNKSVIPMKPGSPGDYSVDFSDSAAPAAQ